MKFTTVQKAILALIIANTIWGAASPIFKLSLQNIPPFTLAFWRFFLGAILLGFIFRKNLHFPITNRSDLSLFLGNSLMGITGNIIFFFLGLQLTKSINAPVIASGGPVIVFFLAVFFLHETFSLKKLLGMLLGTVGILVIIVEPLLKNGMDGSFTGNIFLVVATLAAVLATLFGRSLFQRHNPLTLTFWGFLVGATSFLPLAVYEYLQYTSLYSQLDWRGFLGIGFGAILSSAVAYALFNWGLSKISASDTSLFSYIDPIVGTILAFFILHEPITMPFVAGAILIFGGIGIAEGRLHYHPFHKLRTPKFLKADVQTEKPANRKDVLTKLFRSH